MSILQHPWSRLTRWKYPDDPAILPTKIGSPAYGFNHSGIPKRYARYFISGLSIAFLLIFFLLFGSNEPSSNSESVSHIPLLPQEKQTELPPLYKQYRELERSFPQHNLSLPWPEGRHAKFVFFANHQRGSGWGNALQEMILNAHLAYTVKRAFVFDNYTWDRDGPEYSDFGGKLIPARIPLSTMISGPIIGGSFGRNSNIPRAVSREYFNEVCLERTIIHSDEVRSTLSPSPSAAETLAAWVEKLNHTDDKCVEIYRDSPQLFDIWILGSKVVLDIWPSLSISPILTKFSWSPLIHAAYASNKYLLESATSLSGWRFPPSIPLSKLNLRSLSSRSRFKSLFGQSNAFIPPPPHLPNLLALHIRRGDFLTHCRHLSMWSSRYNGFNSFDSLPDKFEPPISDTTEEERWLAYAEHCFPNIDEIVSRVRKVRKELPAPAPTVVNVETGRRGFWWGKGWSVQKTEDERSTLKRIYIMTNGRPEWVKELKDALHADTISEGVDRWEEIVSSRDLKLNWEERYVAQALDMAIGERAGVFVGNGFSSLTSNVVMLRMANGIDPQTTRFW